MEIKLDIETIGQYFRWKMQEKGKTTRQVAEELCMNPSTIWRIASDKPFDLKWLIPIAEWCELTPQELWDFLDKAKLS